MRDRFLCSPVLREIPDGRAAPGLRAPAGFDPGQLIAADCPVCQYTRAAPLFDGGRQPLATLGWPRSRAAARRMPRHELAFVRCPRCTHVWNRSFTYDAIPYRRNPNRMFNKGAIWQGHLRATRDLALSTLPPDPVVVDIGCGDGHFVRGLAEARGGRGRFLGFDPNGGARDGGGASFEARYFEPERDMPALGPDLLVMRHVLEHLTDPAAFVDRLAWGAAALGKPVLLFAEMPCIDRVFATSRLVDFFYEHPSQFTTRSFRTLLARGGEIRHFAHGYDGEVVFGIVELDVPAAFGGIAAEAGRFRARAEAATRRIAAQLDALAVAGARVAIWAAPARPPPSSIFSAPTPRGSRWWSTPIPRRSGPSCPRPASASSIATRSRGPRSTSSAIPPQWRAKDIVDEMRREGIVAGQVLIEHDGRLIDFFADPHPYR